MRGNKTETVFTSFILYSLTKDVECKIENFFSLLIY